MGYIDLKYTPAPDDVICRFYVEPAYGIAFDAAAEDVVAESSIGTWVEVKTAKPYVERLAAKVFAMDQHAGIIDCAYPFEAFEPANIPQILSSIAGNIFGMKATANLRLLDVKFPQKMLKFYEGPMFGIEGIRKLLKVGQRPLIGTIIKPKMGLNPKDHAEVAYNAWVSGCDIVKDDENLTSQSFNEFEKRVTLTMKARDKAERKTGEKKIYMANITAETEEMLRRAKFVKRAGCEYAMVDIVTVGWAALQTLRAANKRLKLVLHAHRAGHAAFTRNQKHGISMLVLAKFCRMLGLDQLHIGTAVGKMADAGVEEIRRFRDALVLQKIPSDAFVLGQDWGKIKSTFPVASGGLHPGHVPFLIEKLGQDLIIQMGGGIHGHPGGTQAGAKAARDAIEAVMHGIPLKEYKSDELQQALAKFR